MKRSRKGRGIQERSRKSWWELLDEAIDGYESGEFDEAARVLADLVAHPPDDAAPAELADAHFHLACSLDRLGKIDQAEESFAIAERLDAEAYPRPLRLDAQAFDALVNDALDEIPEQFARLLSQVQIAVRDYPGPEAHDPFLLGLYVGIPRTERDIELHDHLDTIFIYKRAHELDSLDADELREEVRKTVIHEIGHHFGLGEEHMGEYA